MYIDLNLIYLLLTVLGCITLVYVIIVLGNLNKLLKNADELLLQNRNTINDSVSKISEVVSDFNYIGKNMKDVTDAITDITADVIVTRENVRSNVEIATEMLRIIKNIFGK